MIINYNNSLRMLSNHLKPKTSVKNMKEKLMPITSCGMQTRTYIRNIKKGFE